MKKQKNSDLKKMLLALRFPILFIAIGWLVFLIDFNGAQDFYQYGVKTRTGQGFLGIFAMPFLHSTENYSHIINNSIPMLVLGWALFYFYKEIAFKVFFGIWLFGGFWLWCLSRDSFHIGASGIVYGLAFFIFVSGYIRKNLNLMGLSMIVAFLYGSMVWGLFPIDYQISFEGHAYGALAGVLLAFWYKTIGTQRKKYQWEIEEELGIEPPDFEGDLLRQQSAANEIKINYILKKKEPDL